MPLPMGDADVIRLQLSTIFPSLKWSNNGILLGADYGIEFMLGKSGPVDSFLLHARGDADSAIIDMCRRGGWQALDFSLGDFLDVKDPSKDDDKFIDAEPTTDERQRPAAPDHLR